MVTKIQFKSLIVGLLSLTFIGLMTVPGAHSQVSKRTSLSQAGQAAIKVTAPSGRQTWNKGAKYPIRWESRGVPGEVTILLVRQDMPASQLAKEPNTAQSAKQTKPIVVVGNTANSGSYDYVVPGDIPDGLYKVQVMTVDGSVKGTSEGTVAIGSKKPEVGKTLRFGDRRKDTEKAAATQAGTAQSAGKAQTAGAAAATGPDPTAGTTPSTAASKTTTPSVAVAGKSQAAAVKVVKVQVNPVKVSEAELKNLPLQKSVASGTSLKFGGHSTPGRKIVVTSPKDGDVWEADKEYTVTWESTGITGDVKIDVAANQYQMHPITARTVNSGAYLFRVPRNFVGDYRVWRARVSTLDGTIYGWSPPSFTLYSQDVDLQCQIYDPSWKWQSGKTIYHDTKNWLEFNVMIRNDGTRLPISINTVLVQIIKEPQEIVCYQEEWGFSGIYPHVWYQLPEPRKIGLPQLFDVLAQHHLAKNALRDGSLRMEVWLDPQNRLGELEGLRQDNKAVLTWKFQY
jgi:hypothetical protein